MTGMNHNITVLFKGGRLSSWHRLTPSQQQSYEQEHVDLMLDISHQHKLQRLAGFRLLAPQKDWERFWLIQFPHLEAAHSWIQAEMAPPYGHYGYYEYYLSRACPVEHYADWIIAPQPELNPSTSTPHTIPPLAAEFTSAVVLLFEREETDHQAGVSPNYINAMQHASHENGLRQLECFELLAPHPAWHRVWIAEFPHIEAAEHWIQAEKGPAHGYLKHRTFVLSRKWAPSYFASWLTNK